MREVSTMDLDIAEDVALAHRSDARDGQPLSRRVTRSWAPEFFASQHRCLVALEAWGGAHRRARELTRQAQDRPLT